MNAIAEYLDSAPELEGLSIEDSQGKILEARSPVLSTPALIIGPGTGPTITDATVVTVTAGG